MLRAGRTPAGLAQSQGALGWARSQSRSLPPRGPGPAGAQTRCRSRTAPARGPRDPRGRDQGARGGDDLWNLGGARVTSWGWRGRLPSRARRRRQPGAAQLLRSVRLGGCPAASGKIPGRQGPDLPPGGPLGAGGPYSHSVSAPTSASALVCPRCKFMLQNLSAEVWKPDPGDAGRRWHQDRWLPLRPSLDAPSHIWPEMH